MKNTGNVHLNSMMQAWERRPRDPMGIVLLVMLALTVWAMAEVLTKEGFGGEAASSSQRQESVVGR